jgi:hypothetical protein
MKDKSKNNLQSILGICKENLYSVCIRTKVGMGLVNNLQTIYPDAIIYNCAKDIDLLSETPKDVVVIFDGVANASPDNLRWLMNIMDISKENKLFVILTCNEDDEITPSIIARTNHLNFANEIHL